MSNASTDVYTSIVVPHLNTCLSPSLQVPVPVGGGGRDGDAVQRRARHHGAARARHGRVCGGHQ